MKRGLGILAVAFLLLVAIHGVVGALNIPAPPTPPPQFGVPSSSATAPSAPAQIPPQESTSAGPADESIVGPNGAAADTTSNTPFIAVGVLILLIGIGFSAYLFFKQRKAPESVRQEAAVLNATGRPLTPEPTSTPSSSPTPEQVKAYIAQLRRDGSSDEQIRQAFLNNGYPQEVIEELMRR